MSWSTIRKATEEDKNRLRSASDRFQKRHALTDDQMGAVQNPSIDHTAYLDNPEELTRLHRLYRQVVRRALREPNADGIAYGYIGFDVD